MKSYSLISKEERKLFPQARFLSIEEQKRYEEEIIKFSGHAYNSLNISEKGSNLFKILLLNQIGIRTAELSELELALEDGMDLKGIYVDIAVVVLKSNGDSYKNNDSLAKSLAEKLKLKSFEHPYIIKGLKIKQGNSFYGLEFETENTEVITAKDFHHKNNMKKFSRINEDYSIEWNDKGNRIFYGRNDGLSRLYLCDELFTYAGYVDLAYSSDNGRVVVVESAKQTQKL